MQVPTPEQVENMMTEKIGIKKEEIAFLVKIIKHAHNSALIGNAKTAFDIYAS
ncbi:hypothetical protein [Sulfurimonas sp. CS5]|uniref:hypothetical protein n=1 Tax=Sulfurimonas sp. CS5 TaxID=3391145 RepID=UPI0039EA2552